MSDRTCSFVKEQFHRYYTQRFEESDVESGFEGREFAALLMKDRIMIRHKSFQNREELRTFLLATTPSDMYYSSAYYEHPDSTDMTSKGWIGADLVFDIDADHIPTSCNKTHDTWTCINCGFSGRGEQLQKCPSCDGERFKENTWPCEECINSAKTETTKLLDILSEDFGFSKENTHTFFSGHRGYHVHVEDEAVKNLDSVARKEIVDYITGLGLDTNLRTIEDKSESTGLRNIGWHRRIAQGISSILLHSEKQDLQKIGLRKHIAEIMVNNKDTMLKNLIAPRLQAMPKGFGAETHKKIVEQSIEYQAAKLDTVVTTDVHRLIRLPGTLHGKTGLKKVYIPNESLAHFDPFKNAIAFKEGFARILVSEAPEFRLNHERFGPFMHERVELPTAAALLLICKKRAEVAT